MSVYQNASMRRKKRRGPLLPEAPRTAAVPKPVPQELKESLVRLIHNLYESSTGGVVLSELPKKYLQNHGEALDFKSYGYPRIINFIEAIPELEVKEPGQSGHVVSVRRRVAIPVAAEPDMQPHLEESYVTSAEYDKHASNPIPLRQLAKPSSGGVFQCPLCEGLVVQPVVTSCGHLICAKCIEASVERMQSVCLPTFCNSIRILHCPVCHTLLPFERAAQAVSPRAKPGSTAQKLWGLLASLELRCIDVDCQWRGAYDRWLHHYLRCAQIKSEKVRPLPQLTARELKEFYDEGDLVNRTVTALLKRYRAVCAAKLFAFSSAVAACGVPGELKTRFVNCPSGVVIGSHKVKSNPETDFPESAVRKHRGRAVNELLSARCPSLALGVSLAFTPEVPGAAVPEKEVPIADREPAAAANPPSAFASAADDGYQLAVEVSGGGEQKSVVAVECVSSEGVKVLEGEELELIKEDQSGWTYVMRVNQGERMWVPSWAVKEKS